MLDHALKRQAQIAANILSCYSNSEKLTTPSVSVEDFQKSYSEETHVILTEEAVEKYGRTQISKSKQLSSVEAKDLIQKSVDEIESFSKVRVVAENGTNKLFFVKKKEEFSSK